MKAVLLSVFLFFILNSYGQKGVMITADSTGLANINYVYGLDTTTVDTAIISMNKATYCTGVLTLSFEVYLSLTAWTAKQASNNLAFNIPLTYSFAAAWPINRTSIYTTIQNALKAKHYKIVETVN